MSSPRPLVLLFVVNDARYFLSHRLSLAKAAAAHGFEVHVATPPADDVTAIVQNGFTHHPFPLSRRGIRPDAEIRTFLALRRLYRELRPDIVHHLTVKPILYGGLAARGGHVGGVVHAITGLGHTFVAEGLRGRTLRAIITWGYRRAFDLPNLRAIFQNPDDRDALVAQGIVTEARSRLIRGSGVEMERFRPQPEPEGVIVAMLPSRMIRHKGIPEFVEAARILGSRGAAVRMVLAGDTDDGNPAAVPREEIERWVKEGAVEWWGWQDDMVKAFARAHIVCLPSYYGEGVPRVLIEAAACAKPIVTTDTPGCREIVEDGRSGLLVPPRNAEALADALGTLASDHALRVRMAGRGREIAVAEFAIERVNAETLCVYDELAHRATI